LDAAVAAAREGNGYPRQVVAVRVAAPILPRANPPRDHCYWRKRLHLSVDLKRH